MIGQGALFAITREQRRSDFLALCQLGTVASPHDWQSGGVKVGDLVPAWVCPECGETELTEFCLQINHGWSELYLGHRGGCPTAQLKAFRARLDASS